MALLSVLVGALQDRLLLQAGHLLQLVYTAEACFGICHTGAEIYAWLLDVTLLATLAAKLAASAASVGVTAMAASGMATNKVTSC